MSRLLLCLPLCLCLGSDRPAAVQGRAEPSPEVFKDDGAALPKADEMEALARDKPIKFLEVCLRRTIREVQGFTAILEKQERIGGKIYPREVTEVAFREKPFSVAMEWKEGVRLADKVLYVAGENDGKMLAKPHGFAARLVAGAVAARDVDGPDARQSSRTTLKEFGFRNNLDETLRYWKAAQDAGTFRYDFQGIKRVAELGDRSCYVLHRVCAKPEMDGIRDVTIYIDAETWLEVGSVLKDADGLLIGSYYFRDVKVNPEFPKDQFTPAWLSH